MNDPNTLNNILIEIQHNNEDIKQLGMYLMIAVIVIICWMPSKEGK